MSQIGIQHSFDLGDGRIVTLETGKLAKQADGAVVVKLGATMILATVVSNKEAKEGVDFLPLTVDYQEKYAATGRFPGGFFRREAKLSDYEVLISRIVDRAMRPLFPDDYHADTQIMLSLISSDKKTMPDALVGLAASAAVAVSDIPFNGPISEVRVGKIDGKLVINPDIDQLALSTIDMIVAASAHDIAMVEGEMSEISETEMLEAIKFAHEAIKVKINAINEFAVKAVLKPNRVYIHEKHDLELKAAVAKARADRRTGYLERRELSCSFLLQFADGQIDQRVRLRDGGWYRCEGDFIINRSQRAEALAPGTTGIVWRERRALEKLRRGTVRSGHSVAV